MDGEPLQDGIESADFSGHPGHVDVMPSGVGRGAVTNPTFDLTRAERLAGSTRHGNIIHRR